MNRELDKLLCERYPSLFRDRDAPMTDTAMCWGFACGPGWFALIDTLCAEIIEPFHGKIFDPACGSGGMFVQSAQFVSRHQKRATEELTVFGTEKANDTVKLAKMNLAVHGL